jgi:hypothetical protein
LKHFIIFIIYRLDANTDTPKLYVQSCPQWPITLLDSADGRRQVAIDFANRCQQILSEALRWAPHTTHGHLQVGVCVKESFVFLFIIQEFVSRLTTGDMQSLRRHAGIALILETVLKCTSQRGTNDTLTSGVLNNE